MNLGRLEVGFTLKLYAFNTCKIVKDILHFYMYYSEVPHLRKRYLEPNIRKLTKFSPLVGILGHRQVGKTTLAGILGKEYYSLDLRTTLDLIGQDPIGFLMSVKKKPGVLDECQNLPDIFPALKEYVRKNPQPGSFILTRSVRFTSRQSIKESLTGRIVNSELLPMNVAEIQGLALPESLLRLAENISAARELPTRARKNTMILEYLEKGGLPGIFAIREASIRKQKLSTQLETILDRDIRLIFDTTLTFATLRNVVQFLAQHQGESIKISNLVRATRVSRPTVQKLFLALEALFLIRPLKCEGDTAARSCYMEDQAEASYLIGPRTDPLFDLTRFLYANLRAQVFYRPQLNTEMFRYETRGGAQVPLCFRFQSREIGVVPIMEQYPNRSAVASATSFLKKYPKSHVVFVNDGNKAEVLSPRLAIVPATTLVLT